MINSILSLLHLYSRLIIVIEANLLCNLLFSMEISFARPLMFPPFCSNWQFFMSKPTFSCYAQCLVFLCWPRLHSKVYFSPFACVHACVCIEIIWEIIHPMLKVFAFQDSQIHHYWSFHMNYQLLILMESFVVLIGLRN